MAMMSRLPQSRSEPQRTRDDLPSCQKRSWAAHKKERREKEWFSLAKGKIRLTLGLVSKKRRNPTFFERSADQPIILIHFGEYYLPSLVAQEGGHTINHCIVLSRYHSNHSQGYFLASKPCEAPLIDDLRRFKINEHIMLCEPPIVYRPLPQCKQKKQMQNYTVNTTTANYSNIVLHKYWVLSVSL